MDSRRRSVMPSGSSIPVPSTIRKPTQNSRLSMAASALRPNVSISLNSAVPGSVSRPSMMRSQNNPLLASVTKSTYKRTPLQASTARRGSVYPGGPAPLQNAAGPSTKDTRPVRDKQFQSKMRQEIFHFLQSAGYEIAPSTLSNIQGKDFRAIFEFLVLNLDPEWPIGLTGRLEDDFIPALKALRYPYVGILDNRWLAAPASPHSWPNLLGVLHWLVDMCKLRDEYLSSDHPTLQDPSFVPEEFEDPLHYQTIGLEFMEVGYELWLNGDDDIPQAKEHFRNRFAKKNERVQKDLAEKTAKLDAIKKELKELKSAELPLVQLQRMNKTLTRDQEKFITTYTLYEERGQKHKKSIVELKEKIVAQGEQLQSLKGNLMHLANIVQEQNLTPEEVAQMNNEHDHLSRNLEELRQRLTDTHKYLMSLEINVTNKAGAAEDALEAYANLLMLLELYPPLPPPWEGVDLTLELNTAASKASDLLSGSDIRQVIKPTLSAVAESKRGERRQLETERVKMENELDKVIQECENVEEEITQMEKQVTTLNEQADDLRDATQQEAFIANQEANRLEHELSQARTAAISNGMGVKTKLNALEFSYREQLDKVARLKEETVRAIIKNSHEIAMFKEEVSRHLTELKEFAEAG